MPVTLNGDAGVTTNSGAVYNGLQTGTAVSASGTSINFTGIPNWAKRITIMFSGVSTNGTSLLLVRAGTSSGIVTSGYDSTAGAAVSAGTYVNTTVGFYITYVVTATSQNKGIIVLANLGGNTWVESGSLSDSVSNLTNAGSSGSVTLSSALDRVSITTVNGTDIFDAGTINIIYE